MKRLLLIMLCLTVVGVILVGCGSSATTTTTTTTTTPAQTQTSTTATSTPASGPNYGGTFTLILTGSPGGNVGWPAEFMGNDSTTPQMIYEGLLRGLADSTFELSLATAWEMAPDKLSATYTLRQGVKFHDGTDFNADAVKAAFDVLIEAKRQVYWDHVEVIDPYTVKLYFTEYRNGIEFSVAGQWIASPTAAAKGGNLDYIRKNPCGTGPFKFVSFQQDQDFVTVKNPDYWREGYPYLDGIKIIFIPDAMTYKAAMQNGEADAVPVELGKLAKDFIDLGFDVLTQHQAVFTLFFDTNNASSHFQDQRVREAVEYAINNEEIAQGLGYDLFLPIKNIIARDNVAYTEEGITYRGYDPEKAKALLEEAGLPNGFKTQITPHIATDKDINLAIKQYLDAVGIETTINYVPDTQYLELRTGKFEGMILEPFAAFANFGTSLSMYLSQTSIFFTNMYKSDELQAFLDEIAHSPVYPDIGIIQDMVRYIADNCLLVPVHDGGMGYAFSSRVGGTEDAFLTLSFPPFFAGEYIWIK
jgi:peptide/nickel transport system substrate-binding protein